MKKLGLLLIAILTMSMVAMIAAPVLAARTPKANQVFVKVVDTNGNPVGKVYVLLYEGNDWWTKDASTSWVGPTRHNGMTVISLTRDTNWGTWVSATIFSVDVYTPSGTSYHFYDFPFSSTLSANIEVTIPVQP